MKQNRLLLIPLLIVLVGCGTTAIGHDPVIVNAEKGISDARATFTLFLKTEYETYAAVKAANPTVAASIRIFANKVRVNQQAWLQTATDLKNTYADNKSAESEGKLNAALAVLAAAAAEATKYIATMTTTHAWLSYQLSDHIGERK